MLPSAARRPTCGKAMNGCGNICLTECFGASLSLVESFPVEVCCSLACWCRLLAEASAFGNDEADLLWLRGLSEGFVAATDDRELWAP